MSVTDRSFRIVRRSSITLPTYQQMIRYPHPRSSARGVGPANSQLTFGHLRRAASETFSKFPNGPILPERKPFPEVTQNQQSARTTIESRTAARSGASESTGKVSLGGGWGWGDDRG